MALANIYPCTLVSARYEQADATAQFTPGDVSIDNQGGRWKYAKASGAVSAYQLCTLTSAATPLAVPATTTTIVSSPFTTGTPGVLGIPQVDIADTYFGWFWQGGAGCGGVGRGIKCLLAVSCAAEVKLCTTGTAGVVDDASVAVSLVQGLKSTATITTAAATEVISSQVLTVNAQDV